jgi:hypothetical protein
MLCFVLYVEAVIWAELDSRCGNVSCDPGLYKLKIIPYL